jgi:hypothetical protein
LYCKGTGFINKKGIDSHNGFISLHTPASKQQNTFFNFAKAIFKIQNKTAATVLTGCGCFILSEATANCL